jgi:hypothetical protein
MGVERLEFDVAPPLVKVPLEVFSCREINRTLSDGI